MSIAIDTVCLQCHMERNLQLARTLGTEEEAMAFAKDLMQMYLTAPEGISSPWFGPRTAELFHQHYALPIDRYRQEKIDSNKFVLERLDLIRERVQEARDPVYAALQFSILGNYLDFSALRGQVSFEKLAEMLDAARDISLDEDTYRKFRQDLAQGKTLLVLTDNAGEIGFDRILAETIFEVFPNLAITFCVRGGITQNDATREDAAEMGIPFPVIDNGNLVPGTQLDQLGDEASQALHTSDVILAKGMANVETMFGCGLNVYYAFLIKCHRFVNRFGKPMFTPMFLRERD